MATTAGHRMESNSGMGPRKTMIIMVTVVGCVAILWPKVFYPMMVGNGQNKNVIKDHRGAGCCGVVLDQETFANASINYATSQQQQEQQQNLFRKRNFAPYVDIDSIRQERPPHLRPEAMHPAMRERGRAIPQSGSIHGGDRPQTPPRIVEGRPGPIPGMRPPMGAGSHQATKSANSMGFIMPLYTIGIVSFFIYTIMKLIFKKTPATPYAEVKPDPAFRNEVFTTEQYIKRPDDGTTKLDQSHATAATNGELVVPVAVSLVHSASPVQAELTIDYEHLAGQKETAKPAEIEQESAREKPPSVQEETENELNEAAAFEARAEELPSEQQPPHDPTTEKVVDGIVVKKVVSLVASANLPIGESAAVEEAVEMAVHERSATNGELRSVDDSVTDAPEHLVNQQIEKESEVEQEVTVEPVVEQQLSVQEVGAEPEIEEVMEVKQVSDQSSVNVPSVETVTGLDEPDAAVQETTYTMDSEPVHETTEALVVESLHNETILESDQSEQLVEAPIATAVQEDVNATKEEDRAIIEPNETREPVAVEENGNQQANEQEFGQEPAVTDHSVVVVSEVITTTLELSTPTAKEEPKVEAGFGQETDQAAEEVVEIVEKQADPAEEEISEAISPTNDETPTMDDSQPEELIDEKLAVEQQHAQEQEEVAVRKVFDPETSALVHETVQDITLAAEQLVQEVLEHAEELAKQHEEQLPEPPAYDPATQKLVDGIVINRFEAIESPKLETVEEAAFQEDVSDTRADEGENVEQPAAMVHALNEEDGAEMDSISEDTSLSVASVIEQLPAPKVSDESAITVQTGTTTDEMIDSTSSELTFDEQPAACQPDMKAEIAPCEPVQEVVEQESESIAAAPESTDSVAVIDQQPLAKESDEQGTLSETLITTEVMSSSGSSEPVFVESSDQPTVETETMLEGTDKADVAGNLLGAAAADEQAGRSVSIEELHDDAAIVDEVEGKVIEEHIVPISVEKASSSDAMTITEVTGDDACLDPSYVPPTSSSVPSESGTAVMDTIAEKPEPVERHEPEKHSSQISPTTLVHVTKEALVERALNEAAAVVNEIESIVDHIITEKLIHSGATDGTEAVDSATVPEAAAPQEPPRLAASAAQVVEAFESKSASVHSMVSSSDSTTPNTQTVTVTNGLTTNLDETIGDTNTPASDSLPTDAPRSFTSASTPGSSEPSSPVPAPTLSPVAASSSATSVASLASVSETHTIHFVADQTPASPRTAGGAADTAANGVHDDGSVRTNGEPSPADPATRIGQVPTSVSNVTNPKFLTLTLANYSTSDSSGNNSKSSSLSIANLSQSGALSAGGDSADQLMELELLRKKLDETERAMTKIIANMGNIPKGQESNVNADEPDAMARETGPESQDDPAKLANGHASKPADAAAESESEKSEKETTGGEGSSAASTPEKKAKKRDTSPERGTVKVMAMEVTAQRENGKRLSRPSTPLLPMGGHSETAHAPAEEQETRSIVLDGRLPHDSKILVSDAETAVEKIEPENSEEEDDAPVILSGKMTLSLINMDYIERDATGSVAVGEIVTELHKPKAELTTASSKAEE